MRNGVKRMLKFDEIVTLASKISKLRLQRDQLDVEISQLIGKLNFLLDDDYPIKQGELNPGSVANRVLKIMKSQPDCIFKIDDLLKVSGRVNVTTALYRLKNKGLIVKLRRGQYRALC